MSEKIELRYCATGPDFDDEFDKEKQRTREILKLDCKFLKKILSMKQKQDAMSRSH